MQQYLDLLSHVMENGTDRMDRTGTGTRGVFGYQIWLYRRAIVCFSSMWRTGN